MIHQLPIAPLALMIALYLWVIFIRGLTRKHDAALLPNPEASLRGCQLTLQELEGLRPRICSWGYFDLLVFPWRNMKHERRIDNELRAATVYPFDDDGEVICFTRIKE